MPALGAADLLRTSLPTLSVSTVRRVQQPSDSGFPDYPGTIRRWTNFTALVRDCCNRQPPSAGELSVERPNSRINTEVYLCAQEKGVEGRFTQNVLHVLEHCAIATQLSVRFADFKASAIEELTPPTSNSSEPDYVCVTRDNTQRMRFVGECKADFDGTMKTDFDASVLDNFQPDCLIRGWLGQIVTYLIRYQLQFGFITTYKHTLFVCLPTHVRFRNLAPEDIVYISNPIPHNSRTGPSSVTVREAMWFLMRCSQDDFKSNPRTPDPFPHDHSKAQSHGYHKNAPKEKRPPPGASDPQATGPPDNTSRGTKDSSDMDSLKVWWETLRSSKGEKRAILTYEHDGKRGCLKPTAVRIAKTGGRTIYVGDIVVTSKKGDRLQSFRLHPVKEVVHEDLKKYIGSATAKRLDIRTKR